MCATAHNVYRARVPLQPDDVSSNAVRHAMAADDLQRWRPLIDVLELPPGQVLYESGAAVRHICFPSTAIMSLLYVMENGSSARSTSWLGKGAWKFPSSWGKRS